MFKPVQVAFHILIHIKRSLQGRATLDRNAFYKPVNSRRHCSKVKRDTSVGVNSTRLPHSQISGYGCLTTARTTNSRVSSDYTRRSLPGFNFGHYLPFLDLGATVFLAAGFAATFILVSAL